MAKVPFPHQNEGLSYGATREAGGFLFMGMRTGKSFTMYLITQSLNSYPCLILCPATVMASWENELLEEGESPEDILILDERYTGSTSVLKNLLVRNYKWVICNFEKAEALDIMGLRTLWYSHQLPFLSRRGISPIITPVPDWRCIVCDESYRISNPDSGITQYLNSYPRPPHQKRFCLSGSPASEAAYNLASQFIFVDGHFMGHKRVVDYMNANYGYCRNTYTYYPKDYGHFTIVRKYVQEHAFCRNMEELGLGCEKLFSSRIVQPNNVQRELLKWVKDVVTYEVNGELKHVEPVTRLMWEQKIAAGVHPITDEWISDSKTGYVVEMVKERPQERFLILSRYTAPILRMYELLKGAGRKVAIINGATPKIERERIRDAFQRGELEDVVCQVSCVKMGLTFSTLTGIIYLNNSFKQDDRTQSEDRGQHTLRTAPYGIIDICCDGFKCKAITQKLRKKQANARFFTDLGQELRHE